MNQDMFEVEEDKVRKFMVGDLVLECSNWWWPGRQYQRQEGFINSYFTLHSMKVGQNWKYRNARVT